MLPRWTRISKRGPSRRASLLKSISCRFFIGFCIWEGPVTARLLPSSLHPSPRGEPLPLRAVRRQAVPPSENLYLSVLYWPGLERNCYLAVPGPPSASIMEAERVAGRISRPGCRGRRPLRLPSSCVFLCCGRPPWRSGCLFHIGLSSARPRYSG